MIPAKLTYFCRSPKQMKDLSGKVITVLPTFPANHESPARMKTAEDWSKTKYHDNDPKLSSSVERKNEPFSYLQIVDLDYRNEGGRAWKVIDSHGHLFDLREEILQEVIVNCQICKRYLICYITLTTFLVYKGKD